jgi:hypothetical protein
MELIELLELLEMLDDIMEYPLSIPTSERSERSNTFNNSINSINVNMMKNKITLIFLFFIPFFLFPVYCRGAVLYLMPRSQDVYEGDSFIVEARLNTEGEEINAIDTGLVFPDVLEIVNFSQGNSILSLWPEKPTLGKEDISFIGGVPNGFSGNGPVLKITFRVSPENKGIVKKAKITFKENSKVLLNDGKGTMAELNLLQADYNFLEKPGDLCLISSKTHPDQNKWYNKKKLHLHWNLKEYNFYSYILSYDSSAKPDDVPDKPEGEMIWMGDMSYDNLEDGIYYFHLKQGQENTEGNLVWGPKTTFRAMIDATKPEPFDLKISQDSSVFEGKYFLSFFTKDTGSGIDHYEILEEYNSIYPWERKEGSVWKTGESPYSLEDQALCSKILVKAVDRAGNEQISEIFPEPKPFPKEIIIFIVILIGIILWIIYKVLKAVRSKSKS